VNKTIIVMGTAVLIDVPMKIVINVEGEQEETALEKSKTVMEKREFS
jgi:hypothetical protein